MTEHVWKLYTTVRFEIYTAYVRKRIDTYVIS